MRNSHLYLYILNFTASLILFATGCKKGDQGLGQVSLTPAEFPLAVGNQWVYQVTDFYANTSDTLTLFVAGLQTSPNGKKTYHCDIFQHTAVVDSGSYSVSGDTISYQGLNPNGYSYFGNFKLQFPFSSGSNWIGFYAVDTVKAISRIDSTTLLGHKYQRVYSLKRGFYLQGGYSLIQFMLIASNVGIINQSIDIFNGASVQNQSFSLISYTLK